ncbi:MAG TPA: T9SS type A sorting domain-containing protein, partial [Rubricoccaceae bacterium]
FPDSRVLSRPLMRLAFLLALLVAAPVRAQSPGTVHGTLVETSTGPYTVGSTVEVAFRLRADAGTADLGTSTFVIDFDGAAASFAAAPTEGATGAYQFQNFQGVRPTPTGGTAGYNSRVVRTNPNRLTVVVDLGFTTDGTGQALPATLTDVVRLRFTVVDPARARVVAFNGNTSTAVQAYTGPGRRYTTGTFTGTGAGSGVIAGTLTGAEGWRMIAAPATGQTVGGLLSPLWTQGYAGSDAGANGASNVYRHAEATGYAAPAAATDALPSGAGLFVYVYADDDQTTPGVQGGFPKALSVSGTEPPAPFAFSGLSYTSTAAPEAAGWNLVGNPFASAIDWDLGWTRTNIDETVYVYDPGLPGYRAWNGIAGNLPGGIVAPFQGFWVRANAPSPALVVQAAARVSSGTVTGPDDEATANAVLSLHLAATLDAVPDRPVAADAFAAFADDASAGRDRYDADALAPPDAAYVQLYTVLDSTALMIQALPHLTSPAELPLGVAAVAGGDVASGSFELSWPELPDGLSVTLLDRETGATVDLREQPSYAFTMAAPPDARPAGKAARASAEPLAEVAARPGGLSARFALRLSPRVASGVEGGSAAPTAFALGGASPNPASAASALPYEIARPARVEIAAYDLLGRRVALLVEGEQGAGRYSAVLDTHTLASGVYVVRALFQPLDGTAAQTFARRLAVVR